MQKKVLMPSMDDLYRMQELCNSKGMGACEIYKYLLAKAVEALVIEGRRYPNKGVLKSAYKYLRENPNIAYAVCRMYPSEIAYSDIAKSDAELCRFLLNKNSDRTIYNLDSLSLFNEEAIAHYSVVTKTVELLDEKLPNNPEYRFEYKSNKLLDDIFSGNLKCDFIPRSSVGDIYNSLCEIEPYYYMLLMEEILKIKNTGIRNIDLSASINKYAERYGIPYFHTESSLRDKDIINYPTDKVKKLIRCINSNKENLY